MMNSSIADFIISIPPFGMSPSTLDVIISDHPSLDESIHFGLNSDYVEM